MIINKEISKLVYGKLTKMKEISKLNLEQDEMDNFFHTINVLNTLKRDENIVGTHVLSKYKILTQLQNLVIPSEITISNSTKEINLVANSYYEYKAEEAFPNTGNTEAKTTVKLLSAADFNVINDAIAGAFKKSATLVDVETLKVPASIDDYVDREMQKDLCAPKTDDYVPVGLNINISKSRYLTEDSKEQLLLWFENKVFRAIKKGEQNNK